MSDLKPCPFCGDPPFMSYQDMDNGPGYWWVQCQNLACWVRPVVDQDDEWPDDPGVAERVARESWNTRRTHEELEAERGTLQVDDLVVGPHMVRSWRKQIAELEAMLDYVVNRVGFDDEGNAWFSWGHHRVSASTAESLANLKKAATKGDNDNG